MPEWGSFFSGLVQGVGETKLGLEKEKRDRKEREEAQKLQVLTTLLSQPGLKPEQKSDLFRMALEAASGGDKKVVDGMHNILGPVLAQGGEQEGVGQAGGVRPTQDGVGGGQAPSTPQPAPAGQPAQPEAGAPTSSLPSSSLQKLGSSGSGGSKQSLFYTPEEETQQVASRAGAVAKATGEVDIDTYKKKLETENELNKTNGFKLTGFTEPSRESGLVTPVYVNELTQQVKYGTPTDPFTSLEAGRAIEVNKAQIALAREEGVGAILRGQGKDPKSATPEERKRAEQAYASVVLEDQQTTIQTKKAGAFRDIASGTAALDKSLEEKQLNMNQQLLDYNRQRDDYDKIGQQVQELVRQVEGSKAEASEAFNQAMVIKNYLESQGLDPNGHEDPDDEAAVKQGYTPATYQLLLGKAKAALSKARSIAQSAKEHFKGQVEAGNLEDEGGKWPYVKDLRAPFTYQPMGLPEMPTRGQSVSDPQGLSPSLKPKPAKKSSQIDVPESLLKDLGLRP